jgi:hypothetical protein
MSRSIALAVVAAAALAGGAAQAADTQLMCKGEAVILPNTAKAPMDVKLTIEGGLEAPSTVTYAWQRADAPIPMSLKGLLGNTLTFHGMQPGKDPAEGVVVADARLDRTTLALSMTVKHVGAPNAEEVNLESNCQP